MVTQVQGTGEYSLEQIYEKLKDPDIQVSKKIKYSHPTKTKNKSINMSIGRVWFNTLLPEDFKLIDEPVTKKVMNGIIKEVIDKYDSEIACDIIQKLQEHAFKMSTINPKTFAIDAFIPSEEWKKKKEDFKEKAPELDDVEFIKQARVLTEELAQEISDKGIGIQDVLVSGTKGGLTDWQALMVSRGFVVDLEDNISRVVPANNDGKSVEDYYKSGGQGRRNYYIKTIMASKPGYLARKVTTASANVKISESDCRTKKSLEMFIPSKRAEKFIGRYMFDTNNKLVLVESPEQIADKTIKLRSPLFCQSKTGICQKCYGNLNKVIKNDNIGIIAGGAVNNETINQMMKLRHKATQVVFVDVDFKEFTAKMEKLNRDITAFFDLQKTKIFAKRPVTVIIDHKQYREEELVDLNDTYRLPGIIDVQVGSGAKVNTLTLPYNFTVSLHKPDEVIENGTITTLNYKKGELVISEKRYLKETNPAVIDRLFDGGARYITEPTMLLRVISDELPLSDSVHIETVVANMFRSEEDPKIPGRLVNYKNTIVIGCKQLPFIDSWLSGLAFENINKAIKTGLINNTDATMNPIERIVTEQHYGEDAPV